MLDVAKVVKEMSEEEAKNALYQVFAKFSRVNGISYTEKKCYEDVERIFKEKVLNNAFGIDKG